MSRVCREEKRTLALKQFLVRGETELDVADDLFSKIKMEKSVKKNLKKIK